MKGYRHNRCREEKRDVVETLHVIRRKVSGMTLSHDCLIRTSASIARIVMRIFKGLRIGDEREVCCLLARVVCEKTVTEGRLGIKHSMKERIGGSMLTVAGHVIP